MDLIFGLVFGLNSTAWCWMPVRVTRRSTCTAGMEPSGSAPESSTRWPPATSKVPTHFKYGKSVLCIAGREGVETGSLVPDSKSTAKVASVWRAERGSRGGRLYRTLKARQK